MVYTTMLSGACEKQAIKQIHHSVMPMSRIDNECLIQGRPHVAELPDADGAAHIRREQLTHRNDELDLRSSENAAWRL
jgi:hypothetical protein